jgi:uroporphyrinogen decarboxylase
MDKLERVLAALEGRRTDRVPFTMWQHRYFQCQTAQGLAASTIGFYQDYGPDLIVLAPGPFFLAEAWGADVRSFSTDDMPPYLAGPVVGRATDWRKLPELELSSSSLTRELEAVRLIRAQVGADRAPLIVPLFSPLMTANMLCSGRVVEDMRSFSNDLRSALEVIAIGTVAFGRACLDAGASGFMLVTDMAGNGIVRPREYRDFGQRFDLQVLEAIAQAPIRILRLVGEGVYLDLADRYPIHAVCWETWRSLPSLGGARRQVRCGLMGGLNPLAFAHGSVSDIRGQIGDALSQTGGWHLLLAPTGPLPVDARDELIAAVGSILGEL